MDRERCRKRPARGRNALRASAAVHARDVMVNQASLLWDFAVFLEHLCILYTSFV